MAISWLWHGIGLSARTELAALRPMAHRTVWLWVCRAVGIALETQSTCTLHWVALLYSMTSYARLLSDCALPMKAALSASGLYMPQDGIAMAWYHVPVCIARAAVGVLSALDGITMA